MDADTTGFNHYALSRVTQLTRRVEIYDGVEFKPVARAFSRERFLDMLPDGMAKEDSWSRAVNAVTNFVVVDPKRVPRSIPPPAYAFAALMAIQIADNHNVRSHFVSNTALDQRALASALPGTIQVDTWRPGGLNSLGELFQRRGRVPAPTIPVPRVRRLTGRILELVQNGKPEILDILAVFEGCRYVTEQRFLLPAIWVGIEQFLVPAKSVDRTALRLALVAAKFLGGSSKSRRRDAFRRIDSLYATRSSIVHGGTEYLGTPELEAAIIDSYDLLRELLEKAIMTERVVEENEAMRDLVLFD